LSDKRTDNLIDLVDKPCAIGVCRQTGEAADSRRLPSGDEKCRCFRDVQEIVGNPPLDLGQNCLKKMRGVEWSASILCRQL